MQRAHKSRVYIDTSVLNFALEEDRIDYALTCNFLQDFRTNEFIPIISNFVKAEIDNAYELRKIALLNLIKKFDIEILDSNEEALNLADLYIREGILTTNNRTDAIHIAIATILRCRFLVSWNFKHIVRAKVIHSVHMLNLREGYGLLEIVSPREFMGK